MSSPLTFRLAGLAALAFGTSALAAPTPAPLSHPRVVETAAARRAGHFTCSFNETRTRLERKNCGGRRT